MHRWALQLLAVLCSLSALLNVRAFDVSRSDNLVVYWGQNSYGATHSDQSGWQKTLSDYCQDDAINVINLAFLHVFFSAGGLPEIDLANTCNSANFPVFPGSNLANCQFLEDDIKTCQARGKAILLSIGGATGAASFTSDAQAQTFATTVWNLFLGGSSSTRPFGNAVLDGIDLDIEGGSSTGFVAFTQKIRSLASGASKRYYLTAAPQCPFPDAYMSPVLNAVGFDAVFVQFYNNYCSLPNFNNPNAWNFAQWDNWAKGTSPNRNVKIYIGAPAAQSAAGSGYVDVSTLGNIARQTRSAYSSFGGVMLWDASQAYGNNRFDIGIKNALAGGSIPAPTSTRTTSTPSTSTRSTSTAPTQTPAPGSCSGVAAWSSSTTYDGGKYVTYNGHLWLAGWWTYNDVPGGPAGVWQDKGACSNRAKSTADDAASTPQTTATATEASRSGRRFQRELI